MLPHAPLRTSVASAGPASDMSASVAKLRSEVGIFTGGLRLRAEPILPSLHLLLGLHGGPLIYPPVQPPGSRLRAARLFLRALRAVRRAWTLHSGEIRQARIRRPRQGHDFDDREDDRPWRHLRVSATSAGSRATGSRLARNTPTKQREANGCSCSGHRGRSTQVQGSATAGAMRRRRPHVTAVRRSQSPPSSPAPDVCQRRSPARGAAALAETFPGARPVPR